MLLFVLVVFDATENVFERVLFSRSGTRKVLAAPFSSSRAELSFFKKRGHFKKENSTVIFPFSRKNIIRRVLVVMYVPNKVLEYTYK